MNDITYQPQPETLIPAKYANLIAELAAAESLFMMSLGVTMNCGDIRLLRVGNGNYIIQELRRMKNGSAEYRHVSTHADIAAAVIAFRAGVVGHPMPQTTPETCEWKPDLDDDSIHSTACGNNHMFITGDMAANHYKYCPYCGLAITES